MDQTNPLARTDTQATSFSALGPGGLNRERASFEVRDVHYSHYGRMCPIETPEGPNIGLIGSLSPMHASISTGLLKTPYRKVDKVNAHGNRRNCYLTADEEDEFVIAQANEPVDEDGRFVHDRVTSSYMDQNLRKFQAAEDVELMDVSPKQLVSVAPALIPIFENDDANRALDGLQHAAAGSAADKRPRLPIIGTGMEYKAAYDSGVMVLAKEAGTVTEGNRKRSSSD
jgi:DNA-directed RNA polymerase subunit beta